MPRVGRDMGVVLNGGGDIVAYPNRNLLLVFAMM